MAINTLTHCGYLYNWYAATGGTGFSDNNSNGYNVAGHICPTSFDLPSTVSGTGGRKTNGTSYNVADFSKLNATMASGNSTTVGNGSDTPAGWQPAGQWAGTIGTVYGAVAGGFTNIGVNSAYYSSTATSSYGGARAFLIYLTSVVPGNDGRRENGVFVRCLVAP